ncbi:Nitrogen metabolite repression protein nmr [Golovinomyces cichoracearum]|uniref:Nitrogen metabolite repression protein nmr n=1 Tax=Golovinomyces cichoracearum TaxID=62708 RepID=A0A420IJ54_9PEZI|nr:Nitrogen metabolite repression protein nmr [Golovinomyces cichoracearum]
MMHHTSSLPYRPHVSGSQSSLEASHKHLKHRPSYSSAEPTPFNAALLPALCQSAVATTSERPCKRPVPSPSKTIAVVNSSGRQAASFIRVASAVGYQVRAQLRNLDGIIATEISCLPNVTVFVGDLYIQSSIDTCTSQKSDKPSSSHVNHCLIKELYRGAQLAFINTTFWGDEVAIGKALADAALDAGVDHYIYSSMPDHSTYNSSWPSLPLWSSKAMVEEYIKSLPPLLARTTFLYTGIYNNNFTSLPYPLFFMELQPDKSFKWTAPFHPDVPLPWLDAEHDVGPAVLQIFKDGIGRWGHGERIALAYEVLSPRNACRAFSKGIGRPVHYHYHPKIEVRVKIPDGYRDQLLALEQMYLLGAKDGKKQPLYFGAESLEKNCPREALEVWEGYRGLEEYAREVFPLEEAANGLSWMNEDSNLNLNTGYEINRESEDSVVNQGGEKTPARGEEGWLA